MDKDELASPLQLFPPIDFCFAYGSALLPCNEENTSTMVDYIFGVADPVQWHLKNLERNRRHYASCMAYFGPEMVTKVADKVGVGVHFNPFVTFGRKVIKYGVVRLEDLIQDLLHWESFYLSGRMQKPVRLLVDKLEISRTNLVNLRAAFSASLLFLPSEFTEEELYSKICSLSYMGDLRMLFAEDRFKVEKIVQGNLHSFREMYNPFIGEFCSKEILMPLSSSRGQLNIRQDSRVKSTTSLVSYLPSRLRGQIEAGLERRLNIHEPDWVGVSSREEVVKCIKKVIRRTVMLSSVRQAASGLLAAGGAQAFRYLSAKISKAWLSRTGSH